MDFVAPFGTDVLATADGMATAYRLTELANKNHCLGNVVIVDHGDVSTLYAHLDVIPASLTSTPTQVDQSAKIGEVGNSVGNFQDGSPCAAVGTHLHFEAKETAVLDNPTGVGQMWGYTPQDSGNPVPADHPDSYGYFDPVLILHQITEFSTIYKLEVSTVGAGVNLRTGPGTNYRGIGLTAEHPCHRKQ